MPITTTNRNLQPIELREVSPPQPAQCTAEIDGIGESDWSELMDRFEDANVYQTWPYGAVRWGKNNLSHLILKQDGEVVGIAQLRIVRPANLKVGIAYLRWGPLCHLRGRKLDYEIVRAMATALRTEYVGKRGLYLEILPNAFSGSVRAEIYQAALAQFDSKPGTGFEEYRTFLLDLSPSLDELRRNLDKKWRNQLNAAERNDLTILEGEGAQTFSKFCDLYAQMRSRKKFKTSVSVGEFGHIQRQLPGNQRMNILICEHQNRPVAGMVCSALGNSAIYLLGATNDIGLKLKASYLLQWTLIRSLKSNGTHYYDLGGIDAVTNPGVYHFKSGLSGTDLSHVSAMAACDNELSKACVKAGQVVNHHVRKFRRTFARYR